MKLLNVILAFLLFVGSAFGAVQGFTSSGANLGHFADVKCGTSMTCASTSGKLVVSFLGTVTTDIIGDGGDQLFGFLENQVASTSVAITAAQCGSTFVSNSADVMVLPEASTVLGCRLKFVCGTADDFDVNPADATDVIGITGSITGANTTTVLAPSAGDALRCTDVGAGFVLEAVAVDLWAVQSTNGIITDVN